MIRATTPTLTLTIKDESVNLQEADNIYVTLVQGNLEITKTGEDVALTPPRTVSVWLTQEESLSLADSKQMEIQVNWTYTDLDSNTRRAATKVKTISVSKQLLKRVIE